MPASSPAGPDPTLEQRLRAETRFARLVHVPVCASTQDLAAEIAESEATEPCFVVWADEQTAGRGRGNGRTWRGAAGLDVEATFRVRGPELASPATLAAALPAVVAAELEPVAGAPIRIKWPNDLLCGGRKLAGILVDAAGNPPSMFAVGIGVNVNRTTFPIELEAQATSLALASGGLLDRSAVLARLARAVDEAFSALELADLGALAAAFRERLGLLGTRVEIHSGLPGADPDRGTLTALDLESATLDGTRTHRLGFVRRLTRAADG